MMLIETVVNEEEPGIVQKGRTLKKGERREGGKKEMGEGRGEGKNGREALEK